jgi:hypothetical protein
MAKEQAKKTVTNTKIYSPIPSAPTEVQEPDFNHIIDKLSVENEKFSHNIYLLKDKLVKLSYYYEDSQVSEQGDTKESNNSVTDILRNQVRGLSNSNEILEFCLRHLNTLI